MAMHASNLLLVKPLLPSIFDELIPSSSSNLFNRIIRNPHPDSAQPRERRCAEMLAALLINASTVREKISEWFGLLCKCPVNFENVTEIKVDTERSTWGKREDLILEGWNRNIENSEPEFVWSVEIKVGSDFHSSSPIESINTEENPPEELIHQVRHYDAILAQRQAKNKAGFVLALTDMSNYLPERLTQQWTCTTWTGFGSKLAEILREPDLHSDDRLLGKHVLGFIASHLWRSSEMPDPKISFDDVALIRAMSSFGQDCKLRAKKLLEPLRNLSEWNNLSDGKLKFYDGLYGEYTMMGFQKFITNDDISGANIFAGIGGEDLCVWVGSPRRFQHKAACRSFLPKLQKLNDLWSFCKDSADDWIDVMCCTPLTTFLDTQDQSGHMKSFVQKALEDLVTVKMHDVIK